MELEDDFAGVIGRTHAESVPDWPAPTRPPDGAPNIVQVVFDDLGFADFGCYGSELETPTVDRLAATGLRYTNFHTTSLCSSSRASLLTGRHHHSVGMRMLSNLDTGFPSGRGRITHRAATTAELLRDVGYNTLCVGKWHLAPTEATTAAGPYDQWPLGRGFERYYGFLEAETDAFNPELFHDNHAVAPPRTPEEGYHLSEDLVDRAIAMVTDQVSVAPERPFYLYLAFSAPHAPHQAPASHLERTRGRFDEGWDVHRARRLARQRELGVFDADVALSPRDPRVTAWDDLDDSATRLAVRLQEAYAAMVEHTDAQLGRLVDALVRLGQFDNTLLMVLSDNGASQEGRETGSLNPAAFQNRRTESVDEMVARIDQVGTTDAQSNYPLGWAQVSNTPFKRYKQNAHEGGVRDPLVVCWPTRITDGGGLRHQFHHVVDLAATVYGVLDIDPPDTWRGEPQLPLHGIDLSYTFDDPAAPGRRVVQHFEMFGHRGLWADGWKAVAFHERGTPFDDDRWELYHLDQDPSECIDLADDQPERLANLVERFWEEAHRYGLLPLDDLGFAERARIPRPGSPRARRRFLYHAGMGHLPGAAAPPVMGRSHVITATIEPGTADGDVPRETNAPGDANEPGDGEVPHGVLLAHGGLDAGYALYVQDRRLAYAYNHLGTRTVIRSEPLTPGIRTLAVSVDVEQDLAARVTLRAGGSDIGSGTVPRVLPQFLGWEGLDVGCDRLTAVSDDYDPPFAWTGRLVSVEVLLQDDPGAYEPHD